MSGNFPHRYKGLMIILDCGYMSLHWTYIIHNRAIVETVITYPAMQHAINLPGYVGHNKLNKLQRSIWSCMIKPGGRLPSQGPPYSSYNWRDKDVCLKHNLDRRANGCQSPSTGILTNVYFEDASWKVRIHSCWLAWDFTL